MNAQRHVTGLTQSCLGILVTLSTGLSSPADPGSLKQRFQAELDRLHRQYEFPGATAAYLLPDGTVEAIATGVADVESATPMTPQSRMLAASVGKMFVGATVLALAEEGHLCLDTPVAQWLRGRSWFRRLPNHDSMTLRHLLTHQSGIGNHVSTEEFQIALRQAVAQPTSRLLPPETSISFVLDQPPLFEPGGGWHYSDTGYLLLGLVMEQVTGRSYYHEVKRRFLDPLDLTLTTSSDRLYLPGLAAGYMAPDNLLGLPSKTISDDGMMTWNPGTEWTGGGLVSNPRDLVRWAEALFTGSALGTPYSESVFESVPIDKAHPNARYGAGIAIQLQGSWGLTYGHGGWIPGYCSSLRYYPEKGVAIAFQINTDIGVVDDSTQVVEEMERRLAATVMRSLDH